MHPRSTLALVLLFACGPVPPAIDTPSTTTPDPGDTTESPPPPTTSITSTTAPATISDPTTLDLTTGTPATTGGDHEFIVKPDGGDPGTIECDVFAQNCPPGQKCAAYAEGGGGAWNATKCVDVTGDGAPGEPCTTTGGGVSGMDDCALGAMCWDVDQTNHGTCIALCAGTPDAPQCPPKSSCSFSEVLSLCIPTCDPLIQDCPDTDLCIPNGESFTCVADASGDTGQANDPCEFANACDKGLVCLNTASASAACDKGSQGCCQPFCELPDSPCPNPDQQCLPWFDPMLPVPPEYANVGVCAIPQ